MSYNITYQNKKEEYFDNAKDFAEKYMKLKKAGELKTIDSVRMEICNFWYPQSEYGIKMILKKGLEKNSGYLLKLITKDNEEEKYLTHDDFLTREKQNAYIFSKEEAENRLSKKTLNSYEMIKYTKLEKVLD